MALTVTVLDDSNHSISASKSILSRQGELGEVITFAIASTLETPYPLAWIHIRQADGSLYYIDDGAGSGFTYDGDNNFTYAIGARDSMLSVEGQLSIQVVLRDAVPPAHTVEWRSRVLNVTVEGSIVTDMDYGASTLNSLQTGVLASLADIQYDSLADGDFLYRDTVTGKWRNVELVAGLNITKTLNKATGELTLAAVSTLGATASNIVVADAGGYFTGSDSEAVLQEVGADLDLKAPLESPALTGIPTAPTATVGTNTTQIATTAFVEERAKRIRRVDDVVSSRTLALTDAGRIVPCAHSSTQIDITVPPNSSVAFPIGTTIVLARTGEADVAVVAGSGVTVSSSDSYKKINKEFETVALYKMGTDTWLLHGALKA